MIHILYVLGAGFFVSTLAFGVILVMRWVESWADGAGFDFLILACRDGNVALISLFSTLVILQRRARLLVPNGACALWPKAQVPNGQTEAAPPQRTVQRTAAAYAGFLQVARVSMALIGFNMVLASAARILLHPAVQSTNQHIWANLCVGLSMFVTAAALSPYCLLWIQTQPLQLGVVSVISTLSGGGGGGGSSSRPSSPRLSGRSSGTVAGHMDDPLSEIELQISPMSTSFAAQWLEGIDAQKLERPEHLELGATIGKGGYGLVLEATRSPTGERVAVKVFDPSLLAKASSVRRLRREVQLGLELRHPNVCATLGMTVLAGRPAIVLELCTRGSVADLVLGIPRSESPVTTQTCVRLVVECARGVAYLHEQGVQHRDLKPDNVLLDHEYRAKICDFGLSSRYGNEHSQSHTQVGTIRYLAVGCKPHATDDDRGPFLRARARGPSLCKHAPPLDVHRSLTRHDGAWCPIPPSLRDTLLLSARGRLRRLHGEGGRLLVCDAHVRHPPSRAALCAVLERCGAPSGGPAARAAQGAAGGRTAALRPAHGSLLAPGGERATGHRGGSDPARRDRARRLAWLGDTAAARTIGARGC